MIICTPLFRLSNSNTDETRVVNDFVSLLSVEYEVIVVKPIPIYIGLEGFVRRYFGWLLMIINGSIDLSSEESTITKLEGAKVHVIPYRRSFNRFIETDDLETIGRIIASYRPDSVVFHWTLPSLLIAEHLKLNHSINSSLVVHELDPVKYLSRYGVSAKRLSIFRKVFARNEQIKTKVEDFVQATEILHSYYESK